MESSAPRHPVPTTKDQIKALCIEWDSFHARGVLTDADRACIESIRAALAQAQIYKLYSVRRDAHCSLVGVFMDRAELEKTAREVDALPNHQSLVGMHRIAFLPCIWEDVRRVIHHNKYLCDTVYCMVSIVVHKHNEPREAMVPVKGLQEDALRAVLERHKARHAMVYFITRDYSYGRNLPPTCASIEDFEEEMKKTMKRLIK